MNESEPRVSRRSLLTGGAVTAAGVAGGALGYRERASLRSVELAMRARPLSLPPEADDFERRAGEIEARRRSQTAETVARLKLQYQDAVFGRMNVWELVEKLAFCIDPTDRRLFAVSQYVHMQQILAGMEQNGVDDPDFILAAVLHDLGKVLLLTEALPENVVCGTERLERAAPGVGLSNVIYQFGHGEFIYSRIADHVPEHVAWMVRFHNVDLGDAAPFLDDRERVWAERYLIPFKQFDSSFASAFFQPKVDMAPVRELIESKLPRTILF